MAFEPLKKVLVGLDGSGRSYEVVKYIAKVPYFREFGTKISLFGVYEAMPKYLMDLGKEPQFQQSFGEVQSWELQKKRDLENFMEKARDDLIEAGIDKSDLNIKIRRKRTGVARDIIGEARSGYGAVMIGRKGAGTMKNVVLGSIAMKLLSGVADMPLALIGRDVPLSGKILVAMDNSEYSMRAVDFVAVNLAGKDYEIHLVHVLRDDVDTPREITDLIIDEIAPVLNEAKSRLLRNGFDEERVKTKIVTGQRSRAKAIMDEADNQNIGTIMAGRRGFHQVTEFFMGRVSNKIVQMARFNAVWVIS